MARPRCSAGCSTSMGSNRTLQCSDKSVRTDGTFSREDFTYDHAGDVYRCPSGKVLTTTGTLVNDGATMLYVATKRDCDRCALKSRCCPKQASRKVPRSLYEGARDMAHQIARSWEGHTSRRLRKKIGCLRTSSAFSISTVYGYGAQMARVTSSSSQPRPKTLGRWPS